MEILEQIRLVIQLDAIFLSQFLVQINVCVEQLIIIGVFDFLRTSQNVPNISSVPDEQSRVEVFLAVAFNKWVPSLQLVVGPAKVFGRK